MVYIIFKNKKLPRTQSFQNANNNGQMTHRSKVVTHYFEKINTFYVFAIIVITNKIYLFKHKPNGCIFRTKCPLVNVQSILEY